MTGNSETFNRREFVARSAVVFGALSTVGAQSAPPSQQKGDGKDPATENESEKTRDPSEITVETIEQAEKLTGVPLTPEEREPIAQRIGRTVRGYERRMELELPNGLAPGTAFDPRVSPVTRYRDDRTARSPVGAPLPSAAEDLAFAPVTHLSHWIQSRRLTSVRLTELYLARLKKYGPKLECVITLTEDLALEQARRADREIAAGRARGPLHGIPWGAKDLLDTKGIATTWGAAPYRDRVATTDAAVVQMLERAGAVLVAKTTLGALAYGDIWFGGKTRNPFDAKQGSSGSSAGSAAGTAAGLFGFGLGTETLGSIVSPCMRCGATGLRPTFGRVPRTGAMALCWSLDKIGPICRTVEDTALVLEAISGQHPGDPSSIDAPFHFDATRKIEGLKVGYDPRWFEGRRTNSIDRRIPDLVAKLGLETVELVLPEWPYGTLRTILNAEAAAAFEELTLTNKDDELVWQAPQAWPNSFRQARFIPAIELIQADRFRRRVCQMMDEKMKTVDLVIGPSYAGAMLLITNNTGHPSLTLRAGFREDGNPHGITLWGRLFDEMTILRVGMALEKELGVWDRRPDLGA